MYQFAEQFRSIKGQKTIFLTGPGKNKSPAEAGIREKHPEHEIEL